MNENWIIIIIIIIIIVIVITIFRNFKWSNKWGPYYLILSTSTQPHFTHCIINNAVPIILVFSNCCALQ
jgi:signal peptidase I